MATKEELKALFATGKKPTGADFASLIDGVEGAKGAAGIDGYVTQEMYDALIVRLDALDQTP